MARQAIVGGLYSPVYVNETGTRQAVAGAAEYLNETQAGAAATPPISSIEWPTPQRPDMRAALTAQPANRPPSAFTPPVMDWAEDPAPPLRWHRHPAAIAAQDMLWQHPPGGFRPPPIYIGYGLVLANVSASQTYPIAPGVPGGALITMFGANRQNAQALSSVTDQAGNSYTLGTNASNATVSAQMAYSPSSLALNAGQTQTTTWAAAGGGKIDTAVAIIGATASPFDFQGNATFSSTSVGFTTAAFATNYEILLVEVVTSGLAGAAVFTPDPRFTPIAQHEYSANGLSTWLGYMIVTAGAALTYAGSFNTAQSGVVIWAAFKLAGPLPPQVGLQDIITPRDFSAARAWQSPGPISAPAAAPPLLAALPEPIAPDRRAAMRASDQLGNPPGGFTPEPVMVDYFKNPVPPDPTDAQKAEPWRIPPQGMTPQPVVIDWPQPPARDGRAALTSQPMNPPPAGMRPPVGPALPEPRRADPFFALHAADQLGRPPGGYTPQAAPTFYFANPIRADFTAALLATSSAIPIIVQGTPVFPTVHPMPPAANPFAAQHAADQWGRPPSAFTPQPVAEIGQPVFSRRAYSYDVWMIVIPPAVVAPPPVAIETPVPRRAPQIADRFQPGLPIAGAPVFPVVIENPPRAPARPLGTPSMSPSAAPPPIVIIFENPRPRVIFQEWPAQQMHLAPPPRPAQPVDWPVPPARPRPIVDFLIGFLPPVARVLARAFASDRAVYGATSADQAVSNAEASDE
jgi:hypothetical protein